MDQRLFQFPQREQGLFLGLLLSSPAATATGLKDAGTTVEPGAQPDSSSGRAMWPRKRTPAADQDSISLIIRYTLFPYFSIPETGIYYQ